MKVASKKKSPSVFSQAVGRALRRAAKAAHKTAGFVKYGRVEEEQSEDPDHPHGEPAKIGTTSRPSLLPCWRPIQDGQALQKRENVPVSIPSRSKSITSSPWRIDKTKRYRLHTSHEDA